MRNYRKYLILASSIVLVACSGKGNCNTNDSQGSNGDVTKVKITSPYLIPSLSNEDSFGFVLVTNSSESVIKNIHYSVANPVGGGSKVGVDSVTAKICSDLAPAASCKLKLVVPAGTASGALNLSLDNTAVTASKQLTTAATSQLIGVQPTQYTTLSGADGVVGYYYPTVLNGVQYLVFVGTVTSSSVGAFNEVQLVTGSSNMPLPNISHLSDNLGAGMPSLTQGSSFSLLVPVQTTVATQNFKIQLSSVTTDGTISNLQTGTAGYTLSTVANQGIAVLYPLAMSLSTNSPEQQFVMGNIGDTPLTNVSISGTGVTVSGLASTIPPESSSAGSITMTSSQVPNIITVSVNNGKGEETQSVPVNNNPSPSPTPTAGLTLTFTPNNNFFTTTALGTVSRNLTIKNSGNTNEDNLVINLPAHFTAVAASSNSCNIASGSATQTVTLSNNLATNAECNLTVTYANNVVASANTADVTIDYHYNDGQVAPQASIGANYEVTLSTAILTWSPSGTPTPIQFFISNNGIDINAQQFAITNTGDADATTVDLSSSNNYFSFNQAQTTGGSVCNLTSGTITGGGGICNIKVDFGPTLATSSTINATLTANYTYAGNTGGTQTATNDVQGNISAAFGVDIASTSGVTGTGTSGNPYSLLAGNSGFIIIMYSNYGNSSIAGFTTTAAALPTGWSFAAPADHGCNNATLGGGGNCLDKYTLSNPSAASGNYNMLTNVTATWTGNATATQMSGSPDIYYAFTAPPSANISVRATYPSWDNSQTGGTLTDPLLLHYIGGNPPFAYIDITYTNTGDGDATNFATTYNPLPNGWSIRSDNCSGQTLAASGGNCMVEYRFTAPQDIHTTGTEFNNGNVKLSWNDGTLHESQVLTLPAGTPGIGGYNTDNIIYNAIFLDIFISDATVQGQFSTLPGGNNAISNADDFCTYDENNPGTGAVYKALLVAESSSPTSGNSRYACTTQTCDIGESYNWVLQSNLRYASLSNSGQQIGKTNAKAIFDPADIIGSIGLAGTNAWTGLAVTSTGSTHGYYDWMAAYPGYTQGVEFGNMGGNCNNWTSSATLVWTNPATYGSLGNSWNTNYGLFGGSGDGCDAYYPIYCVQQP